MDAIFEAFARMNKNANGQISVAEMLASLSALCDGKPVPPALVHQALAEFGKNESSPVSFSEYVRVACASQQEAARGQYPLLVTLDSLKKFFDKFSPGKLINKAGMARICTEIWAWLTAQQSKGISSRRRRRPGETFLNGRHLP